MDEKTLEREINKYCKSLGVKSIKLNSVNDNGIPDRMYCYCGRTVFMELKGKGKRHTATELQLKYLRDLRQQGFTAEVVDDLDVARRLLDLMYYNVLPTKSQLKVAQILLELKEIGEDGTLPTGVICKAANMKPNTFLHMAKKCSAKGYVIHNGKASHRSRWKITELGEKIAREGKCKGLENSTKVISEAYKGSHCREW